MLSLAVATASSSLREGLDGEHRAEGLVLRHGHVAGAAVEDRRQVVEAVLEVRIVGCRATAPQHRALGDAGGDVRRHLLAVRRADEWPGLGLGVVGAAEPDRRGPLHQPVHELVVDALLDQQARACRADLAGVQEHRREREVESDLEVGVGEDDVGVLAAQLEGDLLDGGGGRRHHLAPGDQTAGEGDQVDAGVLGQRRRGVRPGSQDEVADARGEPGLLEQPHQDDAGVRRELAGLEHEGVAGREAGRDLPRGLQQRVVPGRDQRAHAERLVDDPAQHVLAAGVDDAAGVLGRDVAVVAEHRDHVGDVVLALDQALAGVHRLGQRHLVGVALEQVGHRGAAGRPARAPASPARARGGRRRTPPRRPRGRRRPRPRRSPRRASRRPGSGWFVGHRPMRLPTPR